MSLLLNIYFWYLQKSIQVCYGLDFDKKTKSKCNREKIITTQSPKPVNWRLFQSLNNIMKISIKEKAKLNKITYLKCKNDDLMSFIL